MTKELDNLLRFAALIAVFLTIIGIALYRIRGLEKEIDRYKNAPADTVTVVKWDTTYVDNPTLIEHYESEKEKVAIEVRKLRRQLAEALNLPPDTAFVHDTTTQLVYLPREYAVFKKDSIYRAVVSGVEPRLDTIEVYQKTITNDIVKYVEVKKKTRWGAGVQAGVTWDGKKAKPYAGVGVQYNILSW